MATLGQARRLCRKPLIDLLRGARVEPFTRADQPRNYAAKGLGPLSGTPRMSAETISCESPQRTVARNAANPLAWSWNAAPTPERQPPVGIFRGTPTERWSHDVIYEAGCQRGSCKGCRPIYERIEILEGRLESQSPRFLTKNEKITPLR